MHTGENAIESLQVQMLSDAELLQSLSGLLLRGRRWVAALLAHLGEVEQRRLHLLAGYGSLFAYCVSRLKMSEDEACRRIDVARLARRFPVLLDRLAAGDISLSVAALLKPHLTTGNHLALIGAVAGQTLQRARETLATWFPRPDVAASIRKLPAPKTEPLCPRDAGPRLGPSDASAGYPLETAAAEVLPVVASRVANSSLVARALEDVTLPSAHSAGAASGTRAAEDVELPPTPGSLPPTMSPPVPLQTLATMLPAMRPTMLPVMRPTMPTTPPRTLPFSRSVEPLSAGRYKVQLTASDELKRKIELARDLSRHCVPNGDLSTLVERAFDALLEKLMKRRFASDVQPATAAPSPTSAAAAAGNGTAVPIPTTGPARATSSEAGDWPRTGTPGSRHIANATRRVVVARDEARCCYVGPDGVRCNSRAWLEHDHVVPFARGGSHHPHNVRLFCRAHNRFVAERAFGRAAMARIIERRRAERQRKHGQPRPSPRATDASA